MKLRVISLLCVLLLASGAQASVVGNPHLTVQLPGHGQWLFTEVESEVVVVQPTSGIPLDFTWIADASWYGGTIFGYRYGWDLFDPGDFNDPGWTSADFVPDLLGVVPVDFEPGIHTLHIMVVDDGGSWTLAAFFIDVVSPVPTTVQRWGMLKSVFRGGPR
jgi:hypothetical protein